MRIWHESVSLDGMNQRGKGTLSDFLGIEFIELTDNSLKARMPVEAKHKQPVGILHGGANVVLAETVASTAANSVIDISQSYCVGLEINANHLRSVREGFVIAETSPIHLGRSTQVWHCEIKDQQNKLTCVCRMTASVLTKK